MSAASDFVAGLGAYIASQVPMFAGRVQYDHWYDPVMPNPVGLPVLNILWMGETARPLSNQANALALVDANVQVNAYLGMDPGYTAGDVATRLQTAAEVRRAIIRAYYAHNNGTPIFAGSWANLGSIITAVNTVRLPDTSGYTVFSLDPEISLRRGWDEL